MVGLFGAAIFVAAALLFLVQPMVGKMVLPRLGGSPEVWNTSMVFFQAALLAGYAYAHFSVRLLGVKRQAIAHAALLALPLLLLPIALPAWSPPADRGQSFWLLGILAVTVGAPFFVLAAASPLFQRWLAATEHPAARDPYFLYAASNAGSLLGLLSYPFVVEPLLPLAAQSRLWSAGYVLFALLGAACAVTIVRSARRAAPDPALADPAPAPASKPDAKTADPALARGQPLLRQRLTWVALAFVPSSLMLGVTHYITTDVAAVPLLWVVPLALYLITFIAAFSRTAPVNVPFVSRLLAIVVVGLVLTIFLGAREPAWVLILLHLAGLLLAGLLCHGRLAAGRPDPSRLTEFYLLIAVGGVLGGVFNALLAPNLFNDVLEYPIALVLACLLRLPFHNRPPTRATRTLDVALPLALGLAVIALEIGFIAAGVTGGVIAVVVTGALPVLACFLFSPRPLRFALGIAVLLGLTYFNPYHRDNLLYAERTFFGVHRVVQDRERGIIALMHGTTVHGVQSTDPARAREPLGYYHTSGPAGQVLTAFADDPDKARIALVGLGTGALAAIAQPHHRLTFYEIDPAVVRIAENTAYFTYLFNCRAPYEVVIGDGRLMLEQGEPHRYGIIVLDAFSSDAIPVHLLTREAVAVYLRSAAPGGLLLFHVSNRHLNLDPVLAAIAREHGLAALYQHNTRDERVQHHEAIFSSRWVVLARDEADFGPLLDDQRWRTLTPSPDDPLWTDDFSNILSVFQ